MRGPEGTPAPPVARDDRLPPQAYRNIVLSLRTGLIAALVLLVGGIAAYVAVHPGVTSGGILSSNPIASFLTFSGLARGLAHGSPEAFLTLGILVLVATPIVRVVAGFYYFERGGERTMAGITLVVFVLLLFALLVFGPFVK
ncbi:MAG: DUF1634 domain-containing protein [Thermoplasmata archaeon]